MSVFLKHEPCPNCGSKDNLGVWDDGHKWCFGCGYYIPIPGGSFNRVKIKLKKQEVSTGPVVKLPSDCTNNLPAAAKKWLEDYQIFHQDIVKYGIKWSERAGGLVLPIYDTAEQPIFYQIRRFDKSPKYLTFGKVSNHIPVFGAENQDIKDTKTVVLVEDYVSAIRVGYIAHCLPLFGSHINTELATRLSRVYDNLIIWLDADKYSEAIGFYAKYSYLFKTCATIRTQMDPKEYAHYEISNKLKTQKELLGIT